jgi:LuxR family maltose regulon positive regulatory protein
VSLALGLYRIGEATAADQAMAEAMAISQATGNSYVAVMALCNLAVMQMDRGRLRQAAETFQEALQRAAAYAEEAGHRLAVSGYAYTYLARLLSEWNELEAAMSHVQQGIRLCQQWGEPQLLVGGYLSLAQVLLAVGDGPGALDAIAAAREAARSLSPTLISRITPTEALIRLRQGDLEGADQWAVAAGSDPADYVDISEYWSAQLVLARIHLAHNRLDQGLALLDRILESAADSGRERFVVSALVLRASALQQQGKLTPARAALERALVLAEPEGYVRTWIDEGVPIQDLLRRAAARGIAPDYVGRLLAAFETSAPPPSPLIEPLSKRELEVLRLLAAGLSNQEIAEQLVLAVGTVKKYTHNIYGKLGVHNRTAAATRARELGYLDRA